MTDIAAGFERKETRRFADKARTEFLGVPGDKRKWVWLHYESQGFEGLIRNELPSFWRSSLSHAYADVADDDMSIPSEKAVRYGTRVPRSELVRRAKAMRSAGRSYGEIAKALGVSKSTAHAMVNE
jgi:hypothetical protein